MALTFARAVIIRFAFASSFFDFGRQRPNNYLQATFDPPRTSVFAKARVASDASELMR